MRKIYSACPVKDVKLFSQYRIQRATLQIERGEKRKIQNITLTRTCRNQW